MTYYFNVDTIKYLIIDFDPKKSEKNKNKRNLPFNQVEEFDWETAIYFEDVRKTYSERRFVALGYLNKRLHVLCFAPIEDGVRVISFRKANIREVRNYEKEIINK